MGMTLDSVRHRIDSVSLGLKVGKLKTIMGQCRELEREQTKAGVLRLVHSGKVFNAVEEDSSSYLARMVVLEVVALHV